MGKNRLPLIRTACGFAPRIARTREYNQMKHAVQELLCCFAAFGLIGAGAAFGEPKETKTPAEPKPPIHTVKKGLFRIQVDLEGTFEAQATSEVFIRPETWTDLTVLKAVEHGVRVKRGDLLVALETEKIDQAIADLETANRLADLSIKQTEEELRLMQASTPLNIAAVERTRRIADEDLKTFHEIEGPLARRSADFMLKMAEQYLANQEEELRQLEKMYKADDLTEETEEIILKRARHAVERAKFQLQRAKITRDQTLKFGLPRRTESVKDSAQRQNLAIGHDKLALSLAVNRKCVELEKMKLGRVRSEQKLKKLRADREAMLIKSPADGVVYYGQCVRGKWTDADSAAEKLRVGGTLSENKVFMTIVKPRPSHVRATVPEKQLHYIRPGLKGNVRPTGYPDLKLPAIVHKVNTVPSCGNRFEAIVTVAADRQAEQLAPGMKCSVELVVYEKKDALTVPDSAVAEDEFDDQKHYVFLVEKDGKQKKHPITLGKRTEKRAEVIKGLAEGNRVLKVYPKNEK